MKKSLFILSLVAALLLPCATHAQVTCESGSPLTMSNADTGTATSSYFPAYALYNYSYSEQIIPADELTGLGDIKALMYKPTNTTSNTMYNNCEIYLANVDIDDLSNGFVQDLSSFELVYSGTLNWTAAGWQTIVFDDAFSWDGASNLLIAIRRNNGTWGSSSSFAAYSASAPLAREVHTDASAYTIGSITSAGTAYSTVAWYKFIGCEGTGNACYRVRNLVASNITSDGFTLTWSDALNSGASYTIYDLSDTSLVGTSYDTTFTAYGLNSNTEYQFAVVADCGSGSVSSYTKITVRTACGGYTAVPYSNDFESYTTGDMPNCWLQVATGTNGSNTFPSVYDHSSNSRNGNKYFEFESSASSADTEIVALPEMENISTLRLSMWVANTSNYPATLEVGVLESDGSFTRVDSLALVRFSGTSGWKQNYHEYVTFFNNYSGMGERIALRAVRAGSTQFTLFVDDITVTVAGTPEITYMPARLTVDINTDLDINATVGGDMSTAVFSWNSTMVNAGLASMYAGDTNATINYIAGGIDTVTLIVTNSFGADTAYTIVNARDLSPITEFPYVTGFEAGQDANWQLGYDNYNGWYIDTAVNNTPGGNRALYVSNNNGISNAYTTSSTQICYAYRPIQFADIGDYAISYDWSANGEGSYDYLRAWIAPGTAEFEAGQLPNGTTSTYSYQTSTPAGWIDLGGKMNTQSSWQHQQVVFTIDTIGTYNLVFMWANDNTSGSQPPAAIDNIELMAITCEAPTDLTFDTATATSITLHWSGNATSYSVLVGNEIYDIVYDTTYTIDNLSPSTAYQVMVRALCDPDSSFSTSGIYRTACASISTIPWSEDFSTGTPSAAPYCWTVFNGTPRVYSSSSNAHSGSQYLHFSGSFSNMIALPAFEDPINTMMLRFWTRPESSSYSSCGTFSVGYMTDAADTSSFVALQTYSYNEISSYEEKEVPLNGAPDSAALIAFRHNANSSSYYWYVDDVEVVPMPSCFHPTAVSATATSATDVTVDIIGDENDTYRIYWTDGTTVDSIDITGTSYTLSGLAATTDYTISVATVCSDGTVTSTVSTTVRTLCAAGSCDVEIVMYDSYGDGWNGNAIVGTIDGNQVFSATISSGSTDTYTYSLCASETLVLSWEEGSYTYETSFSISHDDFSVTASGDDYGDGDIIGTINGCPTCSRPTDLAVNSIGTSSASLSWDGFAGSYNVYVITPTDTTFVQSTSATDVTLTGLSSNTVYTYGIQAVCVPGSDSSSLSTIAFRTACGNTALPYSEDFETQTTGETPSCWDNLNGNTNTYGSSYYAHAGNNSIRFDGTYSNMVAMPLFMQDISNLTLTFWTRPESNYNSCGTFDVGYITNVADTSTFVVVEHYNYTEFASGYSASYGEKTVTFSGAPSGARIAFRHNANATNYYWFIDDITVTSGTPGPNTYTVSATTADATMGSASVSPSGTVAEGTSVTFTATPADGYLFVAWMNGSTQVSTANPYTTNVNSDLALTATFEAEAPCTVPTNLAATNVNRTGATLGWTPGDANQNAWQLHLTGTNYDQTFDVANNPTYTVTNLTYGVTYTFEVRAVCGTDRYSDWSAPETFTTTSCEGVTGVHATNVTANSASILWTAPAGATSFELEYGMSGFNRGQGITVTATTNSYTINGLSANMTYDVYVRNVCSEGVYSGWSAKVDFTTLDGEGIDDIHHSSLITLYPNPASSTVTLTGIEGMATVTVVDMNGRKNGEWRVESGELTIDLTGYAQGAYFVRIVSEKVNAIRKLIVR